MVEVMAVEVGLTLLEINGAEAEFSDELSDPSSQDFKNLEHDVCEPVWKFRYTVYYLCDIFQTVIT